MDRILIVEDDEDINNLIRDFLLKDGYEIFQAFSGTEGLFYLDKGIDLFILDLMLPGICGEDFILKVREKSSSPILVVSGKVDVMDRVNVLELGADDFLLKPFEMIELRARVKALLRRNDSILKTDDEILEIKNLKLNISSGEAFYNDEKLDLTFSEFKILREFVKANGAIISRDSLYEIIWGSEIGGFDNSISVHISNLRQKLKKASGEDLIVTVWKRGYRLKI